MKLQLHMIYLWETAAVNQEDLWRDFRTKFNLEKIIPENLNHAF